MKGSLIVCLLFAVLYVNVASCYTMNQLKYINSVAKNELLKELEDVNLPKSQWFDQKLDHFNLQNTQTWKQRFLVNDSFYSPELDGPIFIQIGGEGAISAGYVLSMQMVEYAQHHGALVVALEHRFYGQSMPTEDLSTENLQYLSSQQALADVANFLDWFKREYATPKAQVISFGCSYAGALASWFRLKYPQHTTGSIAGSAPVQATLDFYQYLDVVDQSLSAFTGIDCDNRIQNATDTIQDLLESSNGKQQLQTDFNTCTSLDNNLDISTFMMNLMGNWMGTVQYNDEQGGLIDINSLCGIMEDNSQTAYDAYKEISNLFLKLQGQSCMDISYNDYVNELKNTTAPLFGVGIRSWTYQTCVEFGYYQTTDSKNQPFGDLVPLDYYTLQCNDTFNLGINYQHAINQTNMMYGGNKPHGATNIAFVNGSIDPWHSLSVINSAGFDESIETVFIEGTAHCANTIEYNPNIFPPTLAQAQKDVNNIITKWLAEGNQ